MGKTVCSGIECPVRNTCLRYTERNKVTNCIGGYNVIRKCTNQRRYLQDKSNINESCLRKR